MTKFHDEFFRQTPGEDELVMKIISDINNIDEKVLTQLGETRKNEREFVGYITINDANQNIISIHTRTKPETTNVDYSVCEVKCKTRRLSEITFRKNYEREYLCKSNNFIIGYADLVISVYVTHKFDIIVTPELPVAGVRRLTIPLDPCETMPDVITHSFDEDIIKVIDIIVEAKPIIKDTSAVLRQVKTYMNNRNQPEIHKKDKDKTHIVGAIISYSKISEELIASLNHERVAYIKMERDAQ